MTLWNEEIVQNEAADDEGNVKGNRREVQMEVYSSGFSLKLGPLISVGEDGI